MNKFKALLLGAIFISYPVMAQESVMTNDEVINDIYEDEASSALETTNQVNDVVYEVLSLTYSNNPTIRAARAQFKVAEEALVQAQSGFKPTATANADVSYTNTRTEGNSFITSDGGNLAKSGSLNVNQPLFRGGSLEANARQAEYIVAAQGFSLSETEQDVLYQAVVAYMDVLRDKAVLNLQINNKTLVSRELDEATARFEVGELTRTDVSQSKARLAEAEAGIINAQASVKTSFATFQQITGNLPPPNMSFPSVRFETPQTLNDAISLAMTNNRSIIQAKLSKQIANERITVVEGELLPQIDAVGALSKSYTPSDFIDEQRQLAVGIQASVPLYTGGATRSRIREAQMDKVQNSELIKSAQNRVKQEVISSWGRWEAALATIQARKSQIDAAKVALEGVNYETEFGERTTLDALNANQELLSAQVELVKSKRDEVVTRFALAETLGLLVPQNLGFSTINP